MSFINLFYQLSITPMMTLKKYRKQQTRLKLLLSILIITSTLSLATILIYSAPKALNYILDQYDLEDCNRLFSIKNDGITNLVIPNYCNKYKH
jgi:hypothetical protein